jgi:hypothetical protein
MHTNILNKNIQFKYMHVFNLNGNIFHGSIVKHNLNNQYNITQGIFLFLIHITQALMSF